MARFHDWIELGKSTFKSLSSSDVSNFYNEEWPRTMNMLVAEHRGAIDDQPDVFHRSVRTASAVMYGLAKRLAPHRRAIFALAFVAFFICLGSIYLDMAAPPLLTFFEVVLAFLLLTLLLGMELIDKIRYRDELQLARELQASLIPHAMPHAPPFEIAAFNHIANTVGGDIYDFVPLADGRVAILFGDASGHGMAAGLVMAVAHASWRTQIDVDPAPDLVIGSLNRILVRTGGPRSFFSCCYVLLAPDGTFEAVVAGHPPILKIDRAGKVVERIGRGAYPLGIKAPLAWDVMHGALAAGERLLFHSDGLTETRTPHGREFGDAYVEVIASWHPDLSASSLVELIVAEWRLFSGNIPAEDDVSIAVVKHVAPAPSPPLP